MPSVSFSSRKTHSRWSTLTKGRRELSSAFRPPSSILSPKSLILNRFAVGIAWTFSPDSSKVPVRSHISVMPVLDRLLLGRLLRNFLERLGNFNQTLEQRGGT